MEIFAGLLAGMHLCFALVVLMGRARNKTTMFWSSILLGAVFAIAAIMHATEVVGIGALAYVGIFAGRIFSGRWISFGTGSSSSAKNDNPTKVIVKSIFATGIAIGIVGGIAAIFVSHALTFILAAWGVSIAVDFCLRFDWNRD